jgi:hypothetical protein
MLAACSSGPQLEPVNEDAAPPVPSPQPAPPTPPAERDPGTPESAPAFTLESDPHTVVIDAAGEDPSERRSLAEAAAEERNRRATAGPPLVVIDNESLSDYSNIELTVSDIRAQQAADGEGASEPAPEVDLEELAASEVRWRALVLEARTRWREAYDSIERLQGQVADLRNRFYAEDDPYFRDSQIKSAWDHAIEQLRQARDEVLQAQADLDGHLEAGRVAGAFPGWLREGIEIEPPRDDLVRPEDRSTEDTGIYEPEDLQTGRSRDPEDGGRP